MARVSKVLDVKTLAALKPEDATYRRSDGEGLMIEVRPTGTKIWIVRLTVDGKRRDMGLGGFPAVSLADARAAAKAAKQKAADGTDPIELRSTERAQRIKARNDASEAAERTFEIIAEKYITKAAPGWKDERTADIWRNSLKAHAFPVLGKMPIAEIDRAAVLRAIDDVWTSRPATARKVLRRIGTVLRYAAAQGLRANDDPADARMLRHAGLPSLPGGRKHPSLPWKKVPSFFKALDEREGLAPLALRMCILTVVRSNEVRGATWAEISFDGQPEWTIPGERMKQRRSVQIKPHRVPLSDAAVATLLLAYRLATGMDATADNLPKLAALRGTKLIFPSRDPAKPLSDMALSSVIRRMNEGQPAGAPLPWRDVDGRGAVPHGFRSSFRTWVDDTRPEDAAAAECALAHEDTNQVSGSYRRSDLFDRRVPLMQSWADHCGSVPIVQSSVKVLARRVSGARS
jgi:integrase